jgi:Reverse transcriptase (RNA-dependent DNA polymerase)
MATESANAVAALNEYVSHLTPGVKRKVTSRCQYNTNVIPKKNGKTRTIRDPQAETRHIQNLVLELFRTGEEKQWGPEVIGFRRDHAIAEAAKDNIPVNKHYSVVNIDLKDAFGSVNKRMVRELLAGYGLERTTLQVVYRAVTWKQGIPQGSPSSPALLNALLQRQLDNEMLKRLNGLEKLSGIKVTYVRYADDLTFIIPFEGKRFNNFIKHEAISVVLGAGLRPAREKIVARSTNKRETVPFLGLHLARNSIGLTAKMKERVIRACKARQDKLVWSSKKRDLIPMGYVTNGLLAYVYGSSWRIRHLRGSNMSWIRGYKRPAFVSIETNT